MTLLSTVSLVLIYGTIAQLSNSSLNVRPLRRKAVPSEILVTKKYIYLTIIPRAQMGSESITHEAEGRMDYWLRGHEGEKNNCFSKIQLVGQKYPEWKKNLAS